MKKQVTIGFLAGMLAFGAAGCGTAGGIGDVLGGVLSPAPANQIEGTISGVDTRAQQIFLREADNDRIIAVSYDNRTEVRYQEQTYSVTSLDPGDQVRLRVQNTGNGDYYTDLVQVTQPSTTSGGGHLVSVSGTVRSVDTQRGLFTMTYNNQLVTVTLPYNARAVDVDRLGRLRAGNTVRVQGTWLTETRLELYQFM